MILPTSSTSAPEALRLATVGTVPIASLRPALVSESPDGGIAHTPCTPSVNRFGSFKQLYETDATNIIEEFPDTQHFTDVGLWIVAP